jgi:hypothetical protein
VNLSADGAEEHRLGKLLIVLPTKAALNDLANFLNTLIELEMGIFYFKRRFF